MAVGGECGGPASATQPPPGCGQPALEPRLVLARARGTQDRWVGGEGSSGCEGPGCPSQPGGGPAACFPQIGPTAWTHRDRRAWGALCCPLGQPCDRSESWPTGALEGQRRDEASTADRDLCASREAAWPGQARPQSPTLVSGSGAFDAHPTRGRRSAGSAWAAVLTGLLPASSRLPLEPPPWF